VNLLPHLTHYRIEGAVSDEDIEVQSIGMPGIIGMRIPICGEVSHCARVPYVVSVAVDSWTAEPRDHTHPGMSNDVEAETRYASSTRCSVERFVGEI
jgi:hypothetical protein